MRLLLLTIILLPFLGNAQSISSIGGFWQAQITQIYNSNDRNQGDIYSNKITLTNSGGVQVEFKINTNLNLIAGAAFSAHHQKFTSSFPLGEGVYNYKGRTRLSYLKFPVAAKYFIARRNDHSVFNKKTRFSFYVLGGIELSRLIESDGTTPIYRQDNNSVEYYLPDNSGSRFYKPVIFELLVGGGVDYRLNSEFFISAYPKIEIGLMDMENKEATYKTGDRFISVYSHNGSRSSTLPITMSLHFGINYVPNFKGKYYRR